RGGQARLPVAARDRGQVPVGELGEPLGGFCGDPVPQFRAVLRDLRPKVKIHGWPPRAAELILESGSSPMGPRALALVKGQGAGSSGPEAQGNAVSPGSIVAPDSPGGARRLG